MKQFNELVETTNIHKYRVEAKKHLDKLYKKKYEIVLNTDDFETQKEIDMGDYIIHIAGAEKFGKDAVMYDVEMK